MASKNNDAVSGWVGWIGFASFLLLFAGFFHIIEGLADLYRKTVFVHTAGTVWVFDYQKWGWINIVGGVLLLLASASLMKGGMFGRIFAGFVVVLSMLASAAMIPMYPIWGIAVLIIDACIIYAITVHGGEVKKLQ